MPKQTQFSWVRRWLASPARFCLAQSRINPDPAGPARCWRQDCGRSVFYICGPSRLNAVIGQEVRQNTRHHRLARCHRNAQACQRPHIGRSGHHRHPAALEISPLRPGAWPPNGAVRMPGSIAQGPDGGLSHYRDDGRGRRSAAHRAGETSRRIIGARPRVSPAPAPSCDAGGRPAHRGFHARASVAAVSTRPWTVRSSFWLCAGARSTARALR